MQFKKKKSNEGKVTIYRHCYYAFMTVLYAI